MDKMTYIKRKQKKGGNMSIMHAFADSLWNQVIEYVNAFVVVYRADVI